MAWQWNGYWNNYNYNNYYNYNYGYYGYYYVTPTAYYYYPYYSPYYSYPIMTATPSAVPATAVVAPTTAPTATAVSASADTGKAGVAIITPTAVAQQPPPTRWRASPPNLPPAWQFRAGGLIPGGCLIVLGGLALLAIVLVVVYLILRARSNKAKE